MPAIDTHPPAEELAAFTLGLLNGAEHDAVEAHVAGCAACQVRAAASPDDSLVGLLRAAHTRRGEPRTQSLIMTPPGGSVTEGDMPADDVGPDTPAGLARHERYRVVRLLGRGGMGAVYEAEHLVLGRPVAVKVIGARFLSNPTAVDRFRREARAAARLSHPNIVAAYDAEHAGDTHFLVTEYVAGKTLGRLVREDGPLSVGLACEYVRQAAMGLQHAHERGMVHRDVKPDNLILADGGVVKVLDFGLALLAADRGEDGLTAPNAVMGTPEYMSPEQAEDCHAADIRADVYSLGCTLYFLLAGNAPYPAATSLLKILAHREKPIPVPGGLPEGLPAVLRKMMAKRPEDRYGTPADVAEALKPFTRPAALKSPSRVRWWAAAALLAAGIMAGIVVHRVKTDTGELVITTESDEVEVIIRQGGKVERIVDTKTEKAITLRSGEYELELEGGKGLKLDLEKVALKRGDRVLARIERVKRDVARADGVEILRRMAIPGGHAVYLTGVAPGGKLFAASMNVVGIVVWDGETGKEAYRLVGFLPAFTPDGRTLVVGERDRVEARDASTGKLRRTIRLSGHIWGLFPLPSSGHAVGWTNDRRIHLFDLVAGKILKSWTYDDAIFAATRDGKTLFVKPAGAVRYVVWDITRNKLADSHAELAKHDRIVEFLDGDRRVVVRVRDKPHLADADGNLIRKLPDEYPEGRVAGGQSPTRGPTYLFGYGDGRLDLFNMLTGKKHGSFQLPEGEKIIRSHAIFLSPDSRHACVASDRSIYLLKLPALPRDGR
jgi:hypothetical protein